jgi:hypothetical protein
MTGQRIVGLVAFVMFLVVAAPLEFNLAMFYGETNRALLHGALYFFAVTIAVESLMRLETHPEIAHRTSVSLLKLLLLFPIILFVVDFLPRRFGGNPNYIGLWKFQVPAAVSASILTLVTHVFVETANDVVLERKKL